MTASHETTLTVNKEDEKEVIAANLGDKSGETVEDSNEEAEDPTNEVNKLEKWNHPRINMYRYLTTLFCLILMGMNDAAYGVSLLKAIWKEKLTFYLGFDPICKRLIPHSGAFAYVSPPSYLLILIYVHLTLVLGIHAIAFILYLSFHSSNSYFHFPPPSALVFTRLPLLPRPISLISTQLEVYYNIDYTIISLVFLAPFVGYTLAAFLNNTVHMRFGQLGVATIGPTCKIIAYVVICVHPPYPVLPVIFMFAGFGNGLEDSAWNAWVGNMENANEMLGFLHGAYGLGATISPLVATAMVTKAHLLWYNFYYLMVSFHPFTLV